MTGALEEPFDDHRHIPLSGIRDHRHTPMGELVCQYLHHEKRFAARRTVYTADFGTTEGRGCSRSEAEDRPPEAKQKIDRLLAREVNSMDKEKEEGVLG